MIRHRHSSAPFGRQELAAIAGLVVMVSISISAVATMTTWASSDKTLLQVISENFKWLWALLHRIA